MIRTRGLRPHIRSRRGGVLLDAVVSVGIILVGAYFLLSIGITLPMLLQSFHQFTGM